MTENNKNIIPRPEYPRPRLTRERGWMNLNGKWQFEIDYSNSGIERNFKDRTDFEGEIIVPFVPECELSGVGVTDYMKALWYRRTFTLEQKDLFGRVLLHFGAVDYRCEAFVNGKSVGRHVGGFTPFSFDVTDVVGEGENSIVLYVYDDTRDRLQPSGKQCMRYDNYAAYYTRCTGIWQTVWLEFVPDVYVEKLKLTPDVDHERLLVTLSLNKRFDGNVIASASYKGTPTTSVDITCGGKYVEFSLDIEDAHLWFPESPELYDLEITVGEDHIKTYFGMRKVAIKGCAIEINDRPIYQRLVLDQGYYPTGIYTAPSDEDIKRDIELAKAVGFNGARMHMKVFEPAYSYYADHLGYLIWGEYPNWGLDISDPAALLSMLPEWLEAVERDYNSPALVGWCPFNETQSNRLTRIYDIVFDVTRAIDPMRPIIDTSGWTHGGKTDIFDVHDYDQDPVTFAERYKFLITGEGERYVCRNSPDTYHDEPYFVSEFGGTHWDIDADGSSGWGYGNAPSSIDEVYYRIEGFVNALLDNPKMCGFCYTQLTDVMQEKNGIYSYDRREKFDRERLYKLMTRKAAIEE